MKKSILLFFLLKCGLLFGQTPANDPHWQLVWQDTFSTFNPFKWLKVDWAQHGEPQIYLAQNVSVSNGNLVIKMNNRPTYCPKNPPTIWGACWPCANQWYSYSSGWVETQQTFYTQYGYIESRILLPYGNGFFPAFWTYIGEGIIGSNAAEIDIFEMFGSSPSSEIQTNIHLNYPDGNVNLLKVSPTNFNYNNTWHVYGIEWSPTKIIWYVDGIPVRLFADHGITDSVRIILDFAIDKWALPDYTTPFPAYMYVDYVKVYDLKNDCNTILNVCNYDFSNYDNKVKKSITIGNGSCINSLSSNQNIYLRASEGVLINGDFTVPIGSQLYVDVNPCY